MLVELCRQIGVERLSCIDRLCSYQVRLSQYDDLGFCSLPLKTFIQHGPLILARLEGRHLATLFTCPEYTP
jgi:hypothetical protein